MLRNRLFFGMFCLFCVSSVSAQQGLSTQVIYKWESQGLVYYSHIKPADVVDFIKLDSQGRKIESFTDEFDEIVEIVTRPQSVQQRQNDEGGENIDEMSGAKASAKKAEAELAKERDAEIRVRNCEIARKNMSKLDGGEVYEPDSAGNMMRLKPEQITAKRKNVQRDIDYFCADQ